MSVDKPLLSRCRHDRLIFAAFGTSCLALWIVEQLQRSRFDSKPTWLSNEGSKLARVEELIGKLSAKPREKQTVPRVSSLRDPESKVFFALGFSDLRNRCSLNELKNSIAVDFRCHASRSSEGFCWLPRSKIVTMESTRAERANDLITYVLYYIIFYNDCRYIWKGSEPEREVGEFRVELTSRLSPLDS